MPRSSPPSAVSPPRKAWPSPFSSPYLEGHVKKTSRDSRGNSGGFEQFRPTAPMIFRSCPLDIPSNLSFPARYILHGKFRPGSALRLPYAAESAPVHLSRRALEI